MKKIARFRFVMVFVMMIFSVTHLLYADPPSPPPVPAGHGSSGNVPEGAPIDGGLSILLGLGLVYGGMILLKAGKKNNEQ